LPGQTDAEDHDRIAGGYTEEVAASIPVISAEVIGAAFVKYYYSWPSAPTLYLESASFTVNGIGANGHEAIASSHETLKLLVESFSPLTVDSTSSSFSQCASSKGVINVFVTGTTMIRSSNKTVFYSQVFELVHQEPAIFQVNIDILRFATE